MRFLAAKLRAEGQDVLETAEPGGTRIGLQIRSILLDSANQELSPPRKCCCTLRAGRRM